MAQNLSVSAFRWGKNDMERQNQYLVSCPVHIEERRNMRQSRSMYKDDVIIDKKNHYACIQVCFG